MSTLKVDVIDESTPGAGVQIAQEFAANGETPQAKAAVQAAPGADVVGTAATQTTPWGFATQAQADDLVTRVNELNVLVKELRTLLIANGQAV
jgi:ABC-type uncharacterized transport system substrate-binding protein